VKVPPCPQRLLDVIPDPDTVRSWLAESIRQAVLLRSLLRVAERKAGYTEQKTSSRKQIPLIETEQEGARAR
jgi:hypothetical protein